MMIKKIWFNYFIAFILGILFVIMISNANAETKNLQNTNNVHYEYVYVNGQKYLVFISSNGDIEVVK